MKKIDAYRQTLRTLDNWDDLLLRESRLPGPRGNLELAHAVAQEGDQALFERYLTYSAERAPANTPAEFLAFCGVLGQGELLADGKREALVPLRRAANDPRWRTREAVAGALQRLGQVDMAALLEEMELWSKGSLLERRAAAAALCHPDLLGDPTQVRQVLDILDAITSSILEVEDRRSEEFKALRKGLGYCWSIAVAALPEVGKPMLESWFASGDRDVQWIMKQNLRKKRLARMDAEWVATSQAQMGMG
jgi:hypothetical protein